MSKEEFNKVWKDSSREGILNQFYYEHNELFRLKKEVREFVERYLRLNLEAFDTKDLLEKILEIIDKGE